MRTLPALALAAAALLAGCATPTDPDTAPTLVIADAAHATASSPAVALSRLDRLPVKGRAPGTGYDRDQFGPAWADVDRNGCDTRNDILRRDLTRETFRDACIVESGVLRDPYTGRTIHFARGWGTSTRVQIDHVVALHDAWVKGAQQLTAERRRALANDPLNLLAVDGPTNQRKGASDAASWLPPRRAYRCAYAGRQVAVKTRYQLWVTTAEHDALERILRAC